MTETYIYLIHCVQLVPMQRIGPLHLYDRFDVQTPLLILLCMLLVISDLKEM